MALPIETVHLTSGGCEAWLAPGRGGMVTRLRVDGEDVLYLDEATLADPAKNVRGGIPILFPIAGKLVPDVLPGASAPLKQHGFARNLEWRVAESGAGMAVLALEADATTRAAFPYDFGLRFAYAVGGSALRMSQRFENRGAVPMRIQPGLHPYFSVADKAAARIESDATVAWDNVASAHRRINAAHLDLAGGEVDLHLVDHGKPGTRLVRPGARDVILEWSADQNVLVIWTLPGKPFVCVEPWSAPANALQDSDLGGITVSPGEAHTSTFAIRLDS